MTSTQRVREVMTENPTTLAASSPVRAAAQEMERSGFGAVIVQVRFNLVPTKLLTSDWRIISSPGSSLRNLDISRFFHESMTVNPATVGLTPWPRRPKRDFAL